MKTTLKARPIRYVTFDVYHAPSGFVSVSERWFTTKALAEADARAVLKAREATGAAADTLLTITCLA